MTEPSRGAELVADFVKYIKEAAAEWVESVDDSPPSHVYTAIFSAILFKFLGLLLL